MKHTTVIVIGGGASGLMAAIWAARAGASVTILEHNDRLGKKISVTGNGKCNLTNIREQNHAYRGSEPDFVKGALGNFSVSDTIRFFSELGIYTKNRNGYLYPHSEQASSVVEVLLMEARHWKIKIKTQEHVTDIQKTPDGFLVVTKTWSYQGDKVILACGSCASSVAGADGSGYALARNLGHTIKKPLPALVALRCQGNWFSKWAGVRTDGAVTLCINGIPLLTEQGELQLTEYGISGIPVFQISRYAVRALEEGSKVSLLLNFLSEFTREGLEAFLKTRKDNCPYKTRKELLTGLFPGKLITVLDAREDLVSAIYEFPLKVTGALSMDHAQVCSGGVDTSQVNAHTLESKLVPGLYFAGELLDVDGACGGYNLQWAWSSGMTAGCSSAGASRKELI